MLHTICNMIFNISNGLKVNVIIWGNFILNMPFHVITDSGIHKMAHLMLESYKALNLEFDDSNLVDLGKIFPSVWLAGSFKGTIDSTKSISGMMDHARNINELLTLSKNLVRQRVQYKGSKYFIAVLGFAFKTLFRNKFDGIFKAKSLLFPDRTVTNGCSNPCLLSSSTQNW